MKMITPLLGGLASGERMPDREWLPSDRRTENPGIRKEQEELRIDSWIQVNGIGREKSKVNGWDERKCSNSVLLTRRPQHSIEEP